tara:strand:- start:457 stop:1002 length:546 start_codon:yes stop_codon:yes gene_type:complete
VNQGGSVNDHTQKNIEYAEEVANNATIGDIELTKDSSSLITWITALSTGGVALAISQSVKLISNNSCNKVFITISMISLVIAVIVGVLARFQAQKTIENHRVMLFLKLAQKLVFYTNDTNEAPLVFGERYNNCDYLDDSLKSKFLSCKEDNKRWYSEAKLLIVQILLFLLGYIILSILAVL